MNIRLLLLVFLTLFTSCKMRFDKDKPARVNPPKENHDHALSAIKLGLSSSPQHHSVLELTLPKLTENDYYFYIDAEQIPTEYPDTERSWLPLGFDKGRPVILPVHLFVENQCRVYALLSNMQTYILDDANFDLTQDTLSSTILASSVDYGEFCTQNGADLARITSHHPERKLDELSEIYTPLISGQDALQLTVFSWLKSIDLPGLRSTKNPQATPTPTAKSDDFSGLADFTSDDVSSLINKQITFESTRYTIKSSERIGSGSGRTVYSLKLRDPSGKEKTIVAKVAKQDPADPQKLASSNRENLTEVDTIGDIRNQLKGDGEALKYFPQVYGSHKLTDGSTVILMERVEGIGLERKIYNTESTEFTNIAKKYLGLRRALQKAGYEALDLKPENLIYRTREGTGELILIDFGGVFRRNTTPEEYLSTPHYLPSGVPRIGDFAEIKQAEALETGMVLASLHPSLRSQFKTYDKEIAIILKSNDKIADKKYYLDFEYNVFTRRIDNLLKSDAIKSDPAQLQQLTFIRQLIDPDPLKRPIQVSSGRFIAPDFAEVAKAEDVMRFRNLRADGTPLDGIYYIRKSKKKSDRLSLKQVYEFLSTPLAISRPSILKGDLIAE